MWERKSWGFGSVEAVVTQNFHQNLLKICSKLGSTVTIRLSTYSQLLVVNTALDERLRVEHYSEFILV